MPQMCSSYFSFIREIIIIATWKALLPRVKYFWVVFISFIQDYLIDRCKQQIQGQKNCWVWYTGHDEIINQYKFFRSNEKRYLPIKISTFCRWERRAIKCCSSASLRSATSVLMILSFLWKILNKQIDKKFKTLTLYRSIILSNVCDNISIVLFNSFDFVSLIIVRQ